MISHKDFIQNKYFNFYLAIIDNRIKNPVDRTVYNENHHILPDSMGGTKAKANMVRLYPREHFVVHKILAKCTAGQSYYKMLEAITIFSGNKNRQLKFTSRDYAILKNSLSVSAAKRRLGKKASDETKLKQSLSKKGRKQTAEHIEKNRIRQVGGKKSKETRNNIIIAKTGHKNTPEHNKAISDAQTGRKQHKEWIENNRKAKTGKKRTPEQIERNRLSHTGIKQGLVICSHCGFEGGLNNMTTHHLNNCRYHPNRIHTLLKMIESKFEMKSTEKLKSELLKIRSILVFQCIQLEFLKSLNFSKT